MNKKIVLSLAAAILMAAPAFAAVQNVKVSGAVVETYLNRSDFSFKGAGVESDWRQSVFLSQATLRVDADLSDNVSATVGLINERAWGGEDTATGTPASGNTDVQLYLAYVTLREFLYSPLTVNIGRQVFAFGNSLVFDATGTNNAATGNLKGIAADLTMRTSLDAIRATLDYKPLTIDLFWSKASQTKVGGLNEHPANGTDVYGINANYQLGDAMNTVVEGYIFGRTVEKGAFQGLGSATSHKNSYLYIPGLRASTNPVKGLNVQAEAAMQGGNSQATNGGVGVGNVKRAYAFQGLASYSLPVAELEKYKPTVSASYTYVSGDRKTAPHSKNSSWDPFFENQGGGTIYNSLFNLTNLQIINGTVSISPLADVTTSLSYNGLWSAVPVAKSGLSMTEPDGSTTASFVPTTNSKNNHLGNEFDANVTYAYTEDVKFGLNLGWFVPGDAFSSQSDRSAKQAIASVGVNF